MAKQMQICLYFKFFHIPPCTLETDELLPASLLHAAGANDLHAHSQSSSMTAAGSSTTKKAIVLLNGSGNAFNEMTTTTSNGL